MKLKFKLLLATLSIFLILIILIFFSNSPEAKLAIVLSTEPIKASRLVEYENCSVSGILDTYDKESLFRYHPAEQECKMVYMISTLRGHSLPSFLYNNNRICTVSKKMEQVIVGYDVIYRIDDSVGKVRTASEPGLFIPLTADGRLNLTSAGSIACETMRRDIKEVIPFYCIKQVGGAEIKDKSKVLELHPTKNTYGFFE